MESISAFDIRFLDRQEIQQLSPTFFRQTLQTVFDASIPWEDPQYDQSFQNHYVEHASACVLIFNQEKPIAMSLAFSHEGEQEDILYVAGIWVDEHYKSRGLGKLITKTLIECGFATCFQDKEKPCFIALRTQNPQVYEYFCRNYELYPRPSKAPDAVIKNIAAWVHTTYSPNKEYDADKMIIRRVFPEGIVVGHLHSAKQDQINSYFFDNLDIRQGDSYILVAPFRD